MMQHSTYVFFGSKINCLQILYQDSLKVYSLYVVSLGNYKLLEADSLALSKRPTTIQRCLFPLVLRQPGIIRGRGKNIALLSELYFSFKGQIMYSQVQNQ